MLYKIYMSSRHLKTALVVIILTNLFFLAGTWLANGSFHPKQPYLAHLIFQLDLGSENNLAAWYSSMLLFLSAVMSVICFAIEGQRYNKGFNQWINWGWLVFALIFALLSFDELGSVHENIGDSVLFKEAGKDVLGNSSSGWAIFTALIVLVSLFMLTFSILRLRFYKWAIVFFIAGLLLYLSNPFQENFEIDSYRAALNPETWKRPIFFLLLEEGSEIFGSLCFLIAITLYAINAVKLPGSNSLVLKLELKNFLMFRFTSFIIIAASLSLVLTEIIIADVIAGSQVGVPKNWFPSVIAFIISIYSLNAYNNIVFPRKQIKIIFVIIALLSLVFSVYYGSNLYAAPVNPLSNGALRKEFLTIFLSILSFIPAVYLFILSKNIQVKTGAVLWLAICVAIFADPKFSSEIAFFALCSLLYTLTVYSASLDKLKPVTAETIAPLN